MYAVLVRKFNKMNYIKTRVKKLSKHRECFDQRCALIDMTQCMKSCVSCFTFHLLSVYV